MLEIYERLLAALAQLAVEAERAGVDGIREWTALATLDAIDLGEQLGMLDDMGAALRREGIRAATQDLDRPPP